MLLNNALLSAGFLIVAFLKIFNMYYIKFLSVVLH